MLFNPNIDAAAELKQRFIVFSYLQYIHGVVWNAFYVHLLKYVFYIYRMLDRTISKPHSIYAINETTKAHVLDQWVYKTIRHTLSTLGLCAMVTITDIDLFVYFHFRFMKLYLSCHN